MVSSFMQEHEHWLKIANEDLKMAKLALSQELFSPLTYHCQQAAEKALKGDLIFKKQPIIKTHDLEKLLEICLNFDKNFIKLHPATSVLNPYSSKFRYPTEFDVPDKTDAKLAIKFTKTILQFVSKKIMHRKNDQTNIFD